MTTLYHLSRRERHWSHNGELRMPYARLDLRSRSSSGTLAATSRTHSDEVQDLLRRIEVLTRLKVVFSELSPKREQDLWQVIDDARLAAERADPDTLASTMLALDLLSLELCDE